MLLSNTVIYSVVVVALFTFPFVQGMIVANHLQFYFKLNLIKGQSCGDGICIVGGANSEVSTCPQDCSPSCGDGVCARSPYPPQYAENAANCPKDCVATCGDGVCARVPVSGTAESATNCAKDCTPSCGDDVCSTAPLSGYQKEVYTTCPQDCTPVCGDGLCEGLESCLTCPKDCGCKREYNNALLIIEI